MNSLAEFEYLLTKAQDRHFQEGYKDPEACYTKITKKGDSSNHDYRDATSGGLGRMGYTPETGMMHIDEYVAGTERVATFKKYTIGLVMPEELLTDMASNKRTRQDNVKLFSNFSRDAGESANWTKETICTDFQTKATSTTADTQWPGAGRDAIALAGTHSTLKGAVSWVNVQTAQPLSAVAIAEGITMLSNQPNDVGRPQGGIKDVTLVVGRYWEWRALEILGTDKQVDTANNNVNLLKTGRSNVKLVVNPYLSETDTSWLLLAGHHQLTRFEKQEPTLSKQTDTYSGSRIFRVMMRFGINFFSARGVVYCAGQ